jgi:hypothetical protein
MHPICSTGMASWSRQIAAFSGFVPARLVETRRVAIVTNVRRDAARSPHLIDVKNGWRRAM